MQDERAGAQDVAEGLPSQGTGDPTRGSPPRAAPPSPEDLAPTSCGSDHCSLTGPTGAVATSFCSRLSTARNPTGRALAPKVSELAPGFEAEAGRTAALN